MRNFRINTTLGVTPRRKCDSVRSSAVITRGATAVLNFTFLDKIYTFEQVKQLTFYFKQDKVTSYPMIIWSDDGKTWTLDSHFTYDAVTKTLTFVFSEAETIDLQLADVDSPMEFEVVIQLDTSETLAQDKDATIIERMPPIFVLNSIYSDTAEIGTSGALCSEDTICSSTLICGD